MKVLIVGGGGFIGRAVTHKFYDEGHKVVVLDNFMTGDNNFLESYMDVEVIYGDIRNREMWNKGDWLYYQRDADVIIHLAFPTPLCTRERAPEFADIAIEGTKNLLDYAIDHYIPVVYISSISVYGIPNVKSIYEDSEIKPFLQYGCYKYIGELLTEKYGNSISCNILRVADVFGPYDKRDNAINTFIDKFHNKERLIVKGDGRQTRTFTYVDDIANAIYLASKKFHNDVFNVAGREVLSVNDLIDNLEKISSWVIPCTYERENDKRNYEINSDKFIKVFGEFEEFGFYKGLRKLYHFRREL